MTSDCLRSVLRGTFVRPEHYARVKDYLRQAFDETDALDRLDRLKKTQPEIFDTGEQDLRDATNEILRQSSLTQPGWAIVKSFLRWHTSRESMLATVETLRQSHSEWFKRQR